MRTYWIKKNLDEDGHQDDDTEIWYQEHGEEPQQYCRVSCDNLRDERERAQAIAEILTWISKMAAEKCPS